MEMLHYVGRLPEKRWNGRGSMVALVPGGPDLVEKKKVFPEPRNGSHARDANMPRGAFEWRGVELDKRSCSTTVAVPDGGPGYPFWQRRGSPSPQTGVSPLRITPLQYAAFVYADTA